MKQQINTLKIETKGQGLYEFTSNIVKYVNKEKIENGLLTIYIKHTSCSLLIQENADSDVKKDLLNFFSEIAPESKNYIHKSEGPDDMPAHIKSSLLGQSLTIPVSNSQLNLGVWQGVYLCEHRDSATCRKLVLTLMGLG